MIHWRKLFLLWLHLWFQREILSFLENEILNSVVLVVAWLDRYHLVEIEFKVGSLAGLEWNVDFSWPRVEVE